MVLAFALVSLVVTSFGVDGERIDPRPASGADRVQWELPDVVGASTGHGSGRGSASEWDDGGRANPPPPAPSSEPPLFARLVAEFLNSKIGLVLMGLVVLVLLVALVVGLVQALGSRDVASEPSRRGSSSRGDVADSALASVPAPTTEEIEALAAAGRYAEAIHLLLLRSLLHLQQEGRRRWPRAYTSREILARGRLDERLREPLRVLVESVERSRFGARPIGADDYAACSRRAAEVAAWQEPSA